jgi:hypothetical protein
MPFLEGFKGIAFLDRGNRIPNFIGEIRIPGDQSVAKYQAHVDEGISVFIQSGPKKSRTCGVVGHPPGRLEWLTRRS